MNIAEYCIKKPTVTLSFAVAMLLAGIIGYFRLGRLEDPEFTIKVAQVITVYPGATAEEVANRVTDPLETAIQQMGQLKEVTFLSWPICWTAVSSGSVTSFATSSAVAPG